MADIQQVRVNLAQQTPTTQTGVEVLSEARGARRADGVAASSAQSKVAEMAEEMGMAAAHRANRKDLGERVQKRGAATDLDALARVLRHLERLPDMPQEDKLEGLVAQLRAFEDLLAAAEGGGGGGGAVTAEDILAALRDYDSDVTHQDAMLDTAIGYFSAASVSEEFVELLRQAKEAFHAPEVRGEILAGLAAARAASETGRSLGLDPGALREEYRELLRAQPGVAALYARLAPLADAAPGAGTQAAKMEAVIDALLAAAGRDLSAAEGPSGDPALLGQAKTELQQLKALRSGLELLGGAHAAVLALRPALKRAPGAPSATEFTARALEFVSADQNAAFGVVQSLVRGFEAGGPDAPVLAANALRQAFSDMPDSLMRHRLEKGAAFFGLLDRLVAEEEAAYEAG